jgi:hypothetical protein
VNYLKANDLQKVRDLFNRSSENTTLSLRQQVVLLYRDMFGGAASFKDISGTGLDDAVKIAQSKGIEGLRAIWKNDMGYLLRNQVGGTEASRDADFRTRITAYYKSYLLRDPDEAGLTFWVSYAKSNGIEAVRELFVKSAERQGITTTTTTTNTDTTPPPSTTSTTISTSTSASDAVKILYNRYLGRDPDQAGWDYWKGYYATNGCAAVERLFKAADEAKQKGTNSLPDVCPVVSVAGPAISVARNSTTLRVGETSTVTVTLTNVTGTPTVTLDGCPPFSPGSNFTFTNGVFTRSWVVTSETPAQTYTCTWRVSASNGVATAQDVFTISSATNASTLVTSQVQYLYSALYGRSSDAAGLNYWVGEVVAGRRTLAQVEDLFRASPECSSRPSCVNAPRVYTSTNTTTTVTVPTVASYNGGMCMGKSVTMLDYTQGTASAAVATSEITRNAGTNYFNINRPTEGKAYIVKFVAPNNASANINASTWDGRFVEFVSENPCDISDALNHDRFHVEATAGTIALGGSASTNPSGSQLQSGKTYYYNLVETDFTTAQFGGTGFSQNMVDGSMVSGLTADRIRTIYKNYFIDSGFYANASPASTAFPGYGRMVLYMGF